MSNYPIGADTENAPWNEKEPKPIEITVSITLSKNVVVELSNYTIELDEDGNANYSYDNCDVYKALSEQIELPSDKCPDWDIDDLEIV